MGRKLIDLLAAIYLAAVLGAIYFNLETFIHLTTTFPLQMGFIKLALLATFGEFLKLRRKTGEWDFSDWVPKGVVWGFYGVWFAIVFPLMAAGTIAIIEKGLWPDFGWMFTAFSISLFMNVLALYAWPMMVSHEYFNTVIKQRKLISLSEFGEKLDKKFWFGFIPITVIVFWVPAHTITFMLPEEFRVLMAALLSIALGFILTMKK